MGMTTFYVQELEAEQARKEKEAKAAQKAEAKRVEAVSKKDKDEDPPRKAPQIESPPAKQAEG